MASLYRQLYGVLCCTALSLSFAGPLNSDTLLSHIENLHCAGDQETAADYINKIHQLDLFSPGLPNESPDTHNPSLRAVTLDRLLITLYENSKKHPGNKDLIEQTVIRWNYCSVIDNGQLYNHTKDQRVASSYADSHKNWRGFKSFGLIPTNDNVERFDFTTPYKNSLIRPLADIQLLQSYINHCLPHPDDEHLYRSFGSNFISRLVPVERKTNIKTIHHETFECGPRPLTSVAPLPTYPGTDNNQQNDKPKATMTSKPVNITERPSQLANRTQDDTSDNLQHHTVDYKTLPTPIVAAAKPVNDNASVQVDIPESELVVAKERGSTRVPVNGVPVEIHSIQTLKNTSADVDEPTAVVVIGPSGGGSVTTTNINKSRGLSGSITLENKSFQADQTSLKLAFSYKPLQDSYWFLRSAFNISNQANPITYSWGIGYDDWHSGTWGIQLNHWGPLSSGDGLDVDNAVLEASYKIKSSWLTKNKLASSIALSSPISGNPSLSWGWSWSPFSDWFTRTTFTKAISGGGLDWSYGFGFTRYTPSSLSVEYNNWGVNRFPNANFKANGQLSLIYRWAF